MRTIKMFKPALLYCLSYNSRARLTHYTEKTKDFSENKNILISIVTNSQKYFISFPLKNN